ncbi:glutathione S-transferase Mu 1-like protein, partial [Dinothrombium tinctorium]
NSKSDQKCVNLCWDIGTLEEVALPFAFFSISLMITSKIRNTNPKPISIKTTGETEDELIRLDLAEQQLFDLRLQLIRVAFDVASYEKAREDYLKELPDKLQLLSNFLGDRKFILGDKIT